MLWGWGAVDLGRDGICSDAQMTDLKPLDHARTPERWNQINYDAYNSTHEKLKRLSELSTWL